MALSFAAVRGSRCSPLGTCRQITVGLRHQRNIVTSGICSEVASLSGCTVTARHRLVNKCFCCSRTAPHFLAFSTEFAALPHIHGENPHCPCQSNALFFS